VKSARNSGAHGNDETGDSASPPGSNRTTRPHAALMSAEVASTESKIEAYFSAAFMGRELHGGGGCQVTSGLVKIILGGKVNRPDLRQTDPLDALKELRLQCDHRLVDSTQNHIRRIERMVGIRAGEFDAAPSVDVVGEFHGGF
jgi:hypothetical protein